MFPQHALASLSFSKTQSLNPAASHTLSSRLDLQPPIDFMPGVQSLWEVGQGEAPYSLRNTPNSQHREMEEESDKQIAGTPLTLSSAPLSDIGSEQKHPPYKQFPFKVYDMLEDEAMEPYVRWIKIGHRDASLIPNIEAFTANVIPKHFKEMSQWASFQKQLNNYGFEKQDRGPGKALYVHSENKFRKGRSDLLAKVLRRQKWSTKASKRASPSALISPTAPQSGSQSYTNSKEIWLGSGKEELEMKILELRRELEDSRVTQSMMRSQLQVTENRLLLVENQLCKLLRQKHVEPDKLETPTVVSHLIDYLPIEEQSASMLPNVLLGPCATKGAASGASCRAPGASLGVKDVEPYSTALPQGISSESYLETEMVYGPLVSTLGCLFAAPLAANLQAQPYFL